MQPSSSSDFRETKYPKYRYYKLVVLFEDLLFYLVLSFTPAFRYTEPLKAVLTLLRRFHADCHCTPRIAVLIVQQSYASAYRNFPNNLSSISRIELSPTIYSLPSHIPRRRYSCSRT